MNKEFLEKFVDARFGMFIHWGLYSIPAGVWKGKKSGRNDYAEWIKYQAFWPEYKPIPNEEYDALANEFNPTKFNAEEYAIEAKNAGMKYIIVTTKHHDGFALWDSKVSDYNVIKMTPFKRDIIRELKDACDKHGLFLGAYYSHWLDWNHSGGAEPQWPERPNDPTIPIRSQEEYEVYFQEKCLPQITELLDDYGIRCFWFDSWEKSPLLTEERINKVIELVHSRGGILNSRVGTTWNHSKGDNGTVDYLSMLDNTFPANTINMPWETSGTFNESWGYNQNDFYWKPAPQLLKNLISNVSKNGNYQLNIGPHADGSIPVPSLKRMREVGAWLMANGESIYGAKNSDLDSMDWGRTTMKDENSVYVHVFENDPTSKLTVTNLNRQPKKVYILETGQEVNYRYNGEFIVIDMPKESFGTQLNVIKLEF